MDGSQRTQRMLHNSPLYQSRHMSNKSSAYFQMHNCFTDSEEGEAPDLDALPRRWIRRRVGVADGAVETEVTRESCKKNKA